MNSPINDGPKSNTLSKMLAYAELNEEAFEAHMRQSIFGELVLATAIRPSPLSKLFLQQGFRESLCLDSDDRWRPGIEASINADGAIRIFCDLIAVLGDYVSFGFQDYCLGRSPEILAHWRHDADIVVVQSILWGYEREILGDGGISIIVKDTTNTFEVQFDDHKILVITAPHNQLEKFRQILIDNDIFLKPNLELITDDGHVHDVDRSVSTYRALMFQEARTEVE